MAGRSEGREFSFLTAWCMKPFLSLVVRLNRLCTGWLVSFTIEVAFQVRRVVYVSCKGREWGTKDLTSCVHYALHCFLAVFSAATASHSDPIQFKSKRKQAALWSCSHDRRWCQTRLSHWGNEASKGVGWGLWGGDCISVYNMYVCMYVCRKFVYE